MTGRERSAKYRASEKGKAKIRSYFSSARGRERNAESTRKARTGWTSSMVEAAWRAQGGCCWLCRCAMQRRGSNAPTDMCPDHNPVTKRTRALLCRRCNVLEGWLKGADLSRFGEFGARLQAYYATFDAEVAS